MSQVQDNIGHVRPQKAVSMDYVRAFDAKDYLKKRFMGDALFDKSQEVQPLEFQIQCFYDFYSKFCAHIQHRRVLEFGGGPVIYQAIVATPFVSEVVFADYCEPCREEVQLWKNKDPAAHDWSSFFRYVETEILDSGMSARELEDRLREQLTVIPCNLMQEEPVDAKWGKFHAISTSYCLESVCQSKAEYEDAIRKLGDLLVPGGFLAMLMCMEATFYKVGVEDETELHQLHLTNADVRVFLEKMGFSVKLTKFQAVQVDAKLSDCKQKGFFVAQKR